MNVDEISNNVCALLNQVNQGWTWAAQLANIRNWSRIYRIAWLDYVAGGSLHGAVRNGENVVDEFYPIIWFELKCVNNNQPIGPFELFVPISTKGFSRPARCAAYDNFLQTLIPISQLEWPLLAQACTDYVHNPAIEYIQACPVGINNNVVQIVHDNITQHFHLIDNAFMNLA